jgi:glycosyltransferase involved in cell wall biosynthesis
VFASQLSEELVERGHEALTLYIYAVANTKLRIGEHDVVLGANPDHVLERVGVQPSVLFQMARVVREYAPDVIQLNGARTVKYGAALRHLERRAGWVTVYRNIGDPDYWIRGRAKRLAYRAGVFTGLDGIISLSSRASQAFRDVFGVRVPLDVIPTGVSPKYLEPMENRAAVRERLSTPSGARVVLYVGSLAPEKRLDRLVNAFRELANTSPEAHLWLVGEGPEHESVERRVRMLGLVDRVRFIGAAGNVASYYAAADVFSLTSDTEGIPGALLEASYSGLPVVATAVGLVSDCVVDGETGFLTNTNDVSVASALIRVLGDLERCRRMGDRGRELVRERFLMPDVARRYEAFYRRVLHARRSQSSRGRSARE